MIGLPQVRQNHEDLKEDPCGLMRRLSFRIDVRIGFDTSIMRPEEMYFWALEIMSLV